jgi:hypothetical protein
MEVGEMEKDEVEMERELTEEEEEQGGIRLLLKRTPIGKANGGKSRFKYQGMTAFA